MSDPLLACLEGCISFSMHKGLKNYKAIKYYCYPFSSEHYNLFPNR